MLRLCLVALLLVVVVSPVASSQQRQAVKLFNGRDLSNWNYELSDPNAKMEDTWSVKDGILICTGKPSGFIYTKEEYGDYQLTVSWRYAPGSQGGNNGVLVHTDTSKPKPLGGTSIWPVSIEVQLASENAGDFWVIGTELDVENEQERKKDRRHLNLTDGSEKPIGEWNTMEITCRGDDILVKVNGELVNHATNCSVTKGAISLQSEGAEVHFRQVELKPLGGTGTAQYLVRMDVAISGKDHIIVTSEQELKEGQRITVSPPRTVTFQTPDGGSVTMSPGVSITATVVKKVE